MGIVHYLRDGMNGLVNRMTGVGTRRDPLVHNTYQFSKPGNSELEAIYRSNWIARKIVDIPIEDTLRQGWSWTANDAIITQIEAEEKRLNIRGVLMQSLTRDAIYGGSAFVMGTGERNLSSELDVESIGKGGLKYLTPFHAEDLHIEGLSREPDKLGQPTMFVFKQENGQDLRIHPSRVISFCNRPVEKPLSRMQWEDYWGDSRLANVLSDISGASSALTGGARLMGELAIWTYKINGLADTISTVGGEESVQKLLTMATTLKASLNAVAFDAQDEVDIITANTSGIGETIRAFMQNVAGAADIPYTRFMSASPDGMNATGASDFRNYYDRLVGNRTARIDPQMEKFDQIFLRSALGRFDDKIYRSWKPLWQLSEVEQADLDVKKMTMFGSMLDKGLVHDHIIESVVHTTMIESATFPGAEEAIKEAKTIPDPREEEEEESTALPGGKKPGTAANQAKAPAAEVKLRLVKDAAPAPLYVQRKVMNAGQILRWAKEQGFIDLLKPDDLHVTILYSETPVDWMEMGVDMYEDDQMRIGAGGPRIMEKFGDATVITFASSRLKWRHEEMIEAGATHGHPQYQPHISLSYSPQSVDLADVAAYNGPILLGPEIFEPLNQDWKDTLTSDAMFLDKSSKFNESGIARHPAGSSKGGQFAPKNKAGAGAGGSGNVKHGYAAAYTQAQKAHKAAVANYSEVFGKSSSTAAEKTAAAQALAETNAAKKQALKDYYANKGTKAVKEAEAAKPAGLSVAEREAGIAAVKKEKSAALKEYKAHPTGSDEKKAALSVYNEKAATEKKMIEGLEKAKAEGGSTNPSGTAKAAPAKAAKAPTAKSLAAEHDAMTKAFYEKYGTIAQGNVKDGPNKAAEWDAIIAKGNEVKAAKWGIDPNKTVKPSGTLTEAGKAWVAEQDKLAVAKHNTAMNAVLKAHPHPTFGKKEAEAVIAKGLAGQPLGPNQQQLFNTYQKSINPNYQHPSVKSVVVPKLGSETTFTSLSSNDVYKANHAAYLKNKYSSTHQLAYMGNLAQAAGNTLADSGVAQSNYASFNNLTSSQQSALKTYTGSAFSSINSSLRNTGKPPANYAETVKQMDAAFTNATAKKDFMVHRGFAGKAVQTAIEKGEFKVGGTMIDKGYVSTTSSVDVANGFKGGSSSSGYNMLINVKKGQSIAPVASFSNFKGEKEFVLPRNSAFKITHIDHDTKTFVVDLL